MAKIININVKKKVKPMPELPYEYIEIKELFDIELKYLRGLADIELKYSIPNMELMEFYCEHTYRLNELKEKVLNMI